MIEVLFSVLIVILSLKLFPVNFGDERFEITRVIKKNYHGQKSTPFPPSYAGPRMPTPKRVNRRFKLFIMQQKSILSE